MGDSRPDCGRCAASNSFAPPRVICAGHAFIQNVRRGHYELGRDQHIRVVSQSEVMAFGLGVPISAVAYELTTEVFPSSVGWRWSPG